MIREDCVKILRNYNMLETLTNFEVSPCQEFKIKIMGKMFNLRITFCDKDNVEKSADFLLLTILPLRPELFIKEAILYKMLTMKILKYSTRNYFAPICYMSVPQAFIVLQDIHREYRVIQYPLTPDHHYAILDTLIQLHGTTIVYEEKMRERLDDFRIIDDLTDVLKPTVFPFDADENLVKLWRMNTAKAISECIKLLPGYERVDLFKKLYQFVECEWDRLATASETFRNTIVHCDLWGDSMMYKFNHRKDIEYILINFYFARYMPPAYDLLLTLYLKFGLDPNEILNCDDNEYIKYYVTNLLQFLNENNVASNVLDAIQIQVSLNYYKIFAIIEILSVSVISFVNFDLARTILVDEDVYREFYYTNREKYLVNEFLNNKMFKCKTERLLMFLANHFNETH